MLQGQGKQRDAVIAAVYAAAMGRSAWPDALHALAHYAQARCVTLDTYAYPAQHGDVIASNVGPHPALIEYNRAYGRRNALIEASVPFQRTGDVFRASDFVDRRDAFSSDLYQFVYRPLGMKHVAGVCLHVSARKSAHLSIVKAGDADDFSDGELDRLRSIAPHMREAWLGYQHLATSGAELQALVSRCDGMEQPVFVVDACCRIQFANRVAEAWLRQHRCFSTQGNRLLALAPTSSGSLQNVLRRVTSRGASVHSFVLEQYGPQYVLATVFHLRADRFALVITDRNEGITTAAKALRRHFDLTSRESDLVRALADGVSLRDYAESRSISYHTARTHLKNAMQKNGWKRQSELVAAVIRRMGTTNPAFDTASE